MLSPPPGAEANLNLQLQTTVVWCTGLDEGRGTPAVESSGAWNLNLLIMQVCTSE